MPAPPLVLLDANVLVQAPLRDTLLRLAEGPQLFRPLWSDQIFEEVRRTLQHQFGIPPNRIARLEDVLKQHFPESWVTGFDALTPRMTNDEKDRHVLAAAAHATATTLITYNLRHFPLAATQPWRVTAVGPSAFLKALHQAHPAAVTTVLHQQAADIRRTLPDQLQVLHKAIPAFVEYFRQMSPTTGPPAAP
jgi:predicted nucleic acid-binding protein